jgi:F0F1-type ATP synthase epsilon subunit
MKLSLISSDSIVDHDIAWIELNTTTGNLIIQRGHMPAIMVLAPNKPIIFKLKTGKQKTIIAEYGIAEIQRDHVDLIICSAQSTINQ